MRRNFFSQRVGESEELFAAEEAKSLSVFKTEIDRFLINKGIRGYGKRQENGDEKNISHDRMAERTRWAQWPNSAPMSYGLTSGRKVLADTLRAANTSQGISRNRRTSFFWVVSIWVSA